MLALASEISFRDRGRASANLVRLADQLPPGVRERLSVLLRLAADPDGVLHDLNRLHQEQPAAFQRLLRSRASLHALVTVFSNSRFLSEELLKTPEWIEPLPQSGDLYRVLSAEEYIARLNKQSGHGAVHLAAFRRREILRILLRDLAGHATLSDVTEELSNLADAILECAWGRIYKALAARHGEPSPAGISILALGKLGGRELNYSSDIDLMFVYSANGETSGPEPIANKEFYRRACIQLTELLSQYTAHGMCYRVDLRLRPEGTLGEVCIPLDAARGYYEKRARDWELQMFIKARVAAADRAPGRELLEFVEPLTYSSTLDFTKVEAVSEARMRIHEKLSRRRGIKQGFDVKLAPGGIRDIEFLVQCLQRLHGGREPWVRHGGTLLALLRLRDKNLLSEIEYGRLVTAYHFLRNLEHRLQFLEDRQTHSLPRSADEMELLARRMPAPLSGGARTAQKLKAELDQHLDAVKETYARVVRCQLPEHLPVEPPAEMEPVPANLSRVLNEKTPVLAAALAGNQLRHGARAFENFLERILPSPEWIEWLRQDELLAGYIVDLYEHSPFFAEQLNRKPELLAEIREMRLHPGIRRDYAGMAGHFEDQADLRRFYNREMLRVQCESICLRTPIFETLERTSALADCAIVAAYVMALEQISSGRPVPGQMLTVALGRLGMREFDLASDADLVFILPDEHAPEIVFWTQVAERMIQILTAYTGDGVLFAVDTRLRPNGSDGPLVQLESGYKDYFSRNAQAWEGITYMKARAVAGDVEHGTKFLNRLQELDWRRYGQSGRSKLQLRQMRQRLESEQGEENPLKAGFGGYYDIDFALMYLRLKSAGFFFRVLNTPERVDVIEKMGHLEPADARFLLDAATFYRALDHALRLSSGHAGGMLPAAQVQLEMISDLVSRWAPEHSPGQPLPARLREIQTRTREFFDRLFA